MKFVEVRRHSMRRKPGLNLSKEGIELANYAGLKMVEFDYVFTSTLSRAIETAVAMGYEVDRSIEELGYLPGSIFKKLNWPNSLQKISDINHNCIECTEYSLRQAAIWSDFVADLPNESRVLIISHGGIMELGVLGSRPVDEDWGKEYAFGYCEGFVLTYSDNKCSDIEIIRMPEGRRLIESN